MHFVRDYKLEDYILGIEWGGLPAEVQARLKGCFLDLSCALIVGSRSDQFEVGARTAERVYAPGDIAVVGSRRRFGFVGASTVMGHASNAFDIDDGYSMTGIHPGASFIGGVLAAAYEKNISRNDFLAALLAAYETSMRSSHAVIDYYRHSHSSGAFGSIGIAAGVGKIRGLSREELYNALSVADFNATMAPGIISVEYPSMSKDGVPFGAIVGALAVMESMNGFSGGGYILDEDSHRHYLDDLGRDYYVMKLYFKPYPCCRWAQPAIDATRWIMAENGLTPDDIKKITVHSFAKAILLSKIVPTATDEAQYNIAYPVAAAAVHGDFGLEQVRTQAFGDRRVIDMMEKLAYVVDPDMEAQYPARRIARAEAEAVDGRHLVSPPFEPRGEASERVGLDWLTDKFRRFTGSIFSADGQNAVLPMIAGDGDIPLRAIVDEINKPEYWLD